MSSNLMRVDFKQVLQNISRQIKGLKLAKEAKDVQVNEPSDVSDKKTTIELYNRLITSAKEVLSRLSVLKKYLPATIIILILIIGLAIGKRIASLSNQSINIPKSASLPTTTTLPEDSNLAPLKQSIMQFNPQLPDLLLPEFNDSITLQEIED